MSYYINPPKSSLIDLTNDERYYVLYLILAISSGITRINTTSDYRIEKIECVNNI